MALASAGAICYGKKLRKGLTVIASGNTPGLSTTNRAFTSGHHEATIPTSIGDSGAKSMAAIFQLDSEMVTTLRVDGSVRNLELCCPNVGISR